MSTYLNYNFWNSDEINESRSEQTPLQKQSTSINEEENDQALQKNQSTPIYDRRKYHVLHDVGTRLSLIDAILEFDKKDPVDALNDALLLVLLLRTKVREIQGKQVLYNRRLDSGKGAL